MTAVHRRLDCDFTSLAFRQRLPGLSPLAYHRMAPPFASIHVIDAYRNAFLVSPIFLSRLFAISAMSISMDDGDDDARASLVAAALEWAPHSDAASASTYFYNTRTGDLSMTEPDAWARARAHGWRPEATPDSTAPVPPSASAPAPSAPAPQVATSTSDAALALGAMTGTGADGADSEMADASGPRAESNATSTASERNHGSGKTAGANEVEAEDADEPLGEHILRRLRDGWYECEDPNSKLVYFWNRHSNAVQWNAPGDVEPSAVSSDTGIASGAAHVAADSVSALPEAAALAPLPPAWRICFDSHANRLYYWNTENGLRAWSRPQLTQLPVAKVTRNTSGARFITCFSIYYSASGQPSFEGGLIFEFSNTHEKYSK